MKIKTSLVALLLPALLYAQSGNDILKRVQNKFSGLNSFSASFTQQTLAPGEKSAAKSAGKIFYKRKNKFIVELKNQSIISNGSVVWNYVPKYKRVIISNFSDDPTPFSLERFIFDFPPLCRIILLGQEGNNKFLELKPKADNLEFKSVKIRISENWLIERLEILDLGDNRYIFEFSDIKENIDLPETRLNFNPPKGTQVIDLR